jgi:hypothetical protein
MAAAGKMMQRVIFAIDLSAGAHEERKGRMAGPVFRATRLRRDSVGEHEIA